jgi:hypothetical protein
MASQVVACAKDSSALPVLSKTCLSDGGRASGLDGPIIGHQFGDQRPPQPARGGVVYRIFRPVPIAG